MSLARMLAILALAPLVLEVGTGVGFTTKREFDSTVFDKVAPALTARAALEWSAAAVGLRALALIGPAGRYDRFDNKGGQEGFQAWTLLAEVEGHTRAPSLQGFVRAGAGIGQLRKVPPAYGNDSLEGRVAPVLRAALGIRGAVTQSLWLGVEGGILAFLKVSHGETDPSSPRPPPETVTAAMLTVTVGWRR